MKKIYTLISALCFITALNAQTTLTDHFNGASAQVAYGISAGPLFAGYSSGHNMMGYLEYAQKFDASYDRGEPIEFTLGSGQVIQGWDEGIGYMSVGSKATLVIPSHLAYGANPPGGSIIKPYTPLVFDVELVGVTN